MRIPKLLGPLAFTLAVSVFLAPEDQDRLVRFIFLLWAGDVLTSFLTSRPSED